MGFEPTTIRLELFCSVPLSYRSKVDACFGSRKKRQPFSKGVIRFLEYCCCLGIQVFRLLFARGLRIPPYLRCCAYTWPCAMRRVPGRLRTCAERRLGACLCRLGYGNLADYSSPRSTFVADINLSIPQERRKWNASHGEECGAMVPVEQPKRIENPSDDDRNRVGRYHSA